MTAPSPTWTIEAGRPTSRHLLIDIETIPSPWPPSPFDVKVDGRLKDEDKKAADRKAKVQEEWAKQALDPMCGSTLCIGVAGVGSFDADTTSTWWVQPEATTDNRMMNARFGERALLEQLDDHIVTQQVSSLVTWGGTDFDIPWLIKRAMVYKLRGLASALKHLPHHDLCRVWLLGARNKPESQCFRLEHVAKGLGGQRPAEDIGGGGVFGAFCMNDLQSIDHHLRWDVSDLCLIGNRLYECGLWDPAETPRRWG